MSIKIHHGPPGSYKTSGAVQDDLIPAVMEGRVVVTNMRGMTAERVREVLDDVPDTFDLIHVDTSKQEGRDKLARWFHWLPTGAYLFIDEAQSIWPKAWRETDLRKLDYPGGPDKAAEDGRPKDWEDAFDMHRHYNWDVCLTTPNIKKIRDDVRGASEAAYKHKNLSLFGLPWMKGRYIEGWHLADDNGVSSADFMSVTQKRIRDNSNVWKLYDSTTTGKHQQTKAGQNLLKNPRIMALLGVLALAVGIVASRPVPAIFSGDHPQTSLQQNQTAPVLVRQENPSESRTVPVAVAHTLDAEPFTHPLAGSTIHVIGEIESATKSRVHFAVYSPGQLPVTFTMLDLIEAGYSVKKLASCFYLISFNKIQMNVTCGLPDHKDGKNKTPQTAPPAREGGGVSLS